MKNKRLRTEMTAVESMIIVINRAAADAENLKELIEFMDAPAVRTATPTDWRKEIVGHRLEAVFIGADLSDSDVRTVVGEVGEIDPNIPIVMLQEEAMS